MPTTARYSGWDTSSEYHSLRQADASSQFAMYLKPYIEDFIGTFDLLPEYSIADFACGQGSISKEVFALLCSRGTNISRFGLLDVASDNLPVAAEKLINYPSTQPIAPQIEIHKLNGSNLNDYHGKKYDFVYCWDAMVHFDLLDVAGYISSMSKLCKRRALFHHSNLYTPTTDISLNPHWRNFMTAEIFRQICISSDIKVIDQQLISWGIENLDCITYVEIGA